MLTVRNEGRSHRMGYIYKMKYYSAVKTIMYLYKSPMMKVENIILKKRSYMVMILFI